MEIFQQKKFAENNLQHEKSKNTTLQSQIGDKLLEIDRLGLQVITLTKTVNQKQQKIKQLDETMTHYLEFKEKLCLVYNVAENTNNVIQQLQKLYDYIINDRKQIKQNATPQHRQPIKLYQQPKLFNNQTLYLKEEELDQSLSSLCSLKINCNFCNKNIDQETQFQLKCHHNYHRRCFDIMLQRLIDEKNFNPVCVCKQKISLKCISNFSPVYLQQFLQLQLKAIKETDIQIIVSCQNNSCNFFYIKQQQFKGDKIYCPSCGY